MKKLMIALAATAMGIAANAATASWTITSVYDKTGAATATAGSAYIFIAATEDAANTAISQINALAGKGATSFNSALSGHFGYDKAGNAGVFSYNKTLFGDDSLPSNTTLGLTDGQDAYMFAVIVDSAKGNITDASSFYVTNAKSFTAASGTDGSVAVAIGSQKNATNVTGGVWAQVGNVPEPTSGLLLLLGVAGLALRRRQA